MRKAGLRCRFIREPIKQRMENIGDHVLYKNNQLIALNKPTGLGVQADKSGDKALIDLAEIYTNSKLHLIHRIDRPTSGVVLFAKSKKGVAVMNEQIRSGKIKKTYLAIVGKAPAEPEGELIHFLRKNGKTNRTESSLEEKPKTKKAILKYKLLGSSERYHLLEVDLLTGRHHQIRAQLGAIGSPIRGDEKYGFKRGNKDRSIQLHAWKMVFHHPVSKEKVSLQADPPDQPVWKAFAELTK